MKRLTSLGLGAALALVLAGPAIGATPVIQGCVGETVSMHAGPGYGQFVASIATDDHGVGEEVQIVQAGLLEDAAFENTCND